MPSTTILYGHHHQHHPALRFQSDNFSTSRSAKLVFIEFLINVTATISTHTSIHIPSIRASYVFPFNIHCFCFYFVAKVLYNIPPLWVLVYVCSLVLKPIKPDNLYCLNGRYNIKSIFSFSLYAFNQKGVTSRLK